MFLGLNFYLLLLLGRRPLSFCLHMSRAFRRVFCSNSSAGKQKRFCCSHAAAFQIHCWWHAGLLQTSRGDKLPFQTAPVHPSAPCLHLQLAPLSAGLHIIQQRKLQIPAKVYFHMQSCCVSRE